MFSFLLIWKSAVEVRKKWRGAGENNTVGHMELSSRTQSHSWNRLIRVPWSDKDSHSDSITLLFCFLPHSHSLTHLPLLPFTCTFSTNQVISCDYIWFYFLRKVFMPFFWAVFMLLLNYVLLFFCLWMIKCISRRKWRGGWYWPWFHGLQPGKHCNGFVFVFLVLLLFNCWTH